MMTRREAPRDRHVANRQVGTRHDPGPSDAPLDGGAGGEHELRAAVARRLQDDPDLAIGADDRARVRRAVARALAAEGVVAAPEVWARLVRDLVDELAGLGPIEPLLRDPKVTEVMVNGPEEIHVERAGRLERTDARFTDAAQLLQVVARALGPIGARLDRAHPYVDAVLADGLRLHAILPPLAAQPTVTLRRVPAVVPDWEELTRNHTVDAEVRALLEQAVAARENLVVCGPAGVGKTTLLARLLGGVGADRVVVIEDAPELDHPAPHCVHLRTRGASPDGGGEVTVAELLRNALRMRPDRLVVGEVRGREVADLLQAMNTGHAGSMTTVHANGAEEAVVRLEALALLAGIPLVAARAQLASALERIVVLGRSTSGQRRVLEVATVVPVEGGVRTETTWRSS